MYTIGIDLGTSAVKLLLVEEGGKICSSVTKEYPLSFPKPGWSEQAPEDWWKAVTAGLRELLEGVDASQVKGIGCGGQMHGLVVLDENDAVIRPAILWNDGRTAEETAWLNTEIGREKLSSLTANIAFAGFTAPKILWMKKHEPQKFARIRKIMLPKDYINYCLTGVHACDYSDASGMLLLDVKNKCWSDEMLEICGVTKEQMPRLFESYFGVDPNNALHAFAHADGNFHLMGCMLSAASCNKWFCDEILKTTDYAGEQKDISDEKLGNNRVFFLPYLMGERSPINDTDARACFIGMSMDTVRADFVQAVLEGVAFAVRDSFEVAKSLGIPIDSSRLCGGGARSPLWRRIIANVLNIRLDIPQTEEGPGYGGAMLAMVGCGWYDSVQACTDALVSVTDTVEPDPALAARYEVQYQKFRRIYPTVKDLFQKLQ